MSIIVKTQLGHGGAWRAEGRWDTGPRNLLAAVKCARKVMDETGSKGGYRTQIEVDGRVLLPNGSPGWPTSMEEAKLLLL